MRVIDLLNEFHEKGILKLLFDSECMSWKSNFNREIYLKYDALKRQGVAHVEAKYLVADAANIHYKSVERIIRRLEKTVTLPNGQ